MLYTHGSTRIDNKLNKRNPNKTLNFALIDIMFNQIKGFTNKSHIYLLTITYYNV